MADNFIELNGAVQPGGKKLDTEELTVSGEVVQRQRGQIAGTVAGAIADVVNSTPTGTEYGLLIRDITGLSVLAALTNGTQYTRLTDGTNNVSVTVANALKVDGSGAIQPVSGTVSISGSVAVTGPLTDAQLRATPVPVSASSLPLPTGAATEATLLTRVAESTFTARLNTLGQKTMANSAPVVIAIDQAAIPVTGSFSDPSVGLNGAAAPTSSIQIGGPNGSGNLTPIAVRSTIPAGSENAAVTRNISDNRATTGALNALNAEVSVALNGRQGVSFHIDPGTLTATVITEASMDEGASWFQTYWTNPITENHFNFATYTAGPAVHQNFVVPLPSGCTHARLRVSAYTSGTANARITATDQVGYGQNLAQAAVGGTGLPPSAIHIAGAQASTTKLRSIATTSQGILSAFTAAESILEGSLNTGFADRITGRVTTAAFPLTTPIRNTAYTEQTAGAQRSVNSTSGSDSAAGTGIRTVRITYYTLAAGVIAGPFTEDKTMNGVTGVNTTATNICYVQSIKALTVGSTGAAVGTIQLWTGINATGSVFASIAAADRQTRYAHQYVPSGQRLFLLSSAAYNSAASGNVPQVFARFRDPTVSASAQTEMFDSFGIQGSTGIKQIDFPVPRSCTGPAIVEFFVNTDNAGSQVTAVEADFYVL